MPYGAKSKPKPSRLLQSGLHTTSQELSFEASRRIRCDISMGYTILNATALEASAAQRDFRIKFSQSLFLPPSPYTSYLGKDCGAWYGRIEMLHSTWISIVPNK